jgi:hypothetical protein
MPNQWASSKVSEELAAHMYSVKSWITFSLKTKTRVFFEKSVPNNRHCLVCQETVIFTSTAVKTSIFALFYSVVYFVSVFIIIKLCIPSFLSFFRFFILCPLFLTTHFCVFIGISPLFSFRFYCLFFPKFFPFRYFILFLYLPLCTSFSLI